MYMYAKVKIWIESIFSSDEDIKSVELLLSASLNILQITWLKSFALSFFFFFYSKTSVLLWAYKQMPLLWYNKIVYSYVYI